MVNKQMLKAVIDARGTKINWICNALGISPSAWRWKINGRSEFTVREMDALCGFLRLTQTQRREIFRLKH